jgi:hypothetical protein
MLPPPPQGRLAGDLMATLPMDIECWWVAGAAGAAFNCSPLPSGDVAWQAVATDAFLRSAGLEFSAAEGRVTPLAPEGAAAAPPHHRNGADGTAAGGGRAGARGGGLAGALLGLASGGGGGGGGGGLEGWDLRSPGGGGGGDDGAALWPLPRVGGRGFTRCSAWLRG